MVSNLIFLFAFIQSLLRFLVEDRTVFNRSDQMHIGTHSLPLIRIGVKVNEQNRFKKDELLHYVGRYFELNVYSVWV